MNCRRSRCEVKNPELLEALKGAGDVDEKHDIFTRYFDDVDARAGYLKDFVPSRFFPDSIKRILESRAVNLSEYILCPLYKDSEFQIGITGGCEGDESYIQSLYREMGEEVGIIPKTVENETKALYLGLNEESRKIYGMFAVNIKDCSPVLKEHDKAVVYPNPQRTNRKIACIVHGSFDEMLSFLTSDKIYRYHSEDAIIGIAMVSRYRIDTFRRGIKR